MVLRRSQLKPLIPLLALALRLASEPTANVSYPLIAGYALMGRAQALQSLALSWLFSMLSTAVAPYASLASIGRYGVLIAAAVSMVIHKPAISSFRSGRPLIRWTLLLGLFFVVHSLLFSLMADVSVLKAISWTLAITSLIAGWSGVSDSQREQLSRHLFLGLVAVMVLSLPLIAMPAGYLFNGTGFQGIFVHPQAFGLTIALLGGWAVVRMVSLQRPSWFLVLLGPVCLALVVLSEARTAALALVLGVAIAAVTARILSGRPIVQLLPGLRSQRVQFVLGLTLTGIVFAWPVLVEETKMFMAKRSGTANLVETYQISRGGQMEAMWNNFDQHPWLGIGFGIGSVPELMVVERDPILGLPTSALIEKGVLPLAVLEEVGVLGFSLVAVWLLILLRRCTRAGVGPLAVLIVILLLNMGEFSLFSPGYVGLIEMILLAWAATGEPLKRTR